MPEKKILTFLQNQWFHDPARAREIFRRYPDQRNSLIARYLFAGCLTGKRLRTAFGDDLCDQIVWEEVSPEIGAEASSKFPPDPQHITCAIMKFKPSVVVALGKIAVDGVWQTMRMMHQQTRWEYCSSDVCRSVTGLAPTMHSCRSVQFTLITGPHPADRRDPMPRLREIAAELRVLL